MKRTVLLLSLQLILLLLICMTAFMLRPIPWLYKVMIYGAVPLAGGLSAYLLVKRGVNPYLSVLLPPLCYAAAGFFISMGYTPDGAAMILCAFTCIVGAAAADTMMKTKRKGHK